MLFNSFAFLLAFLPVTVIGFFVLAKRGEVWAAAWLAGASLFFYGWWDYRYVPLLLVSVLFNFWCGKRLADAVQPFRKLWLIVAVALNLGLLGYYKYANFFLYSINAIAGTHWPGMDVILPIGISFFTFTQIAFLADTYQGKVREYRFVHYLLFVTYFPHLIAGPVLHHEEMMPQFSDRRNYTPSASNFAVGCTIFCIGLAKKVLLADNMAPYANALFDNPDPPSLLLAWGGMLAYTFQLYFDFSGYSDMAIGLSFLFGIRLPLNFNSPYKSASIVEFWRRWHMTLSRFLRDYLYIALGGNRRGKVRRYANLMITMLLGGLWHGAGWNFVIWGGLHGSYLAINHAWTAVANRWRFPLQSAAWTAIATIITFVAVCFAWVFFRAPDLTTSWMIVQGMVGGFGVGLPDTLGNHMGAFQPILKDIGITFFLGGGARFFATWGWVVFAACIAFFMPNTQQLTRRFEPVLASHAVSDTVSGWLAGIAWAPTRRWAFFIGMLTVASLLSLHHPSQFLYFQF